MSSMPMSSSVAFVEPAKNVTAINSAQGYVFKKSVAVQDASFQSGTVEVKDSAKASWKSLGSVSRAKSVVIPADGSIRYTSNLFVKEFWIILNGFQIYILFLLFSEASNNYYRINVLINKNFFFNS